MTRDSIKKMVLSGVFIALVFLSTYFTRVPTPLPGGYFNLGDASIMIAAVLLGPVAGLIAGAIGSALADLAAGAFIFVPATFIVKGLEGLIAGLMTVKLRKKGIAGASYHFLLAFAVFAAAVIIVAGYFIAEAFVLGEFDPAFGLTAAIAELLPNTIQAVLSAVLGYILILVISKIKVDKLPE